jgi:hypothetical protein
MRSVSTAGERDGVRGPRFPLTPLSALRAPSPPQWSFVVLFGVDCGGEGSQSQAHRTLYTLHSRHLPHMDCNPGFAPRSIGGEQRIALECIIVQRTSSPLIDATDWKSVVLSARGRSYAGGVELLRGYRSSSHACPRSGASMARNKAAAARRGFVEQAGGAGSRSAEILRFPLRPSVHEADFAHHAEDELVERGVGG